MTYRSIKRTAATLRRGGVIAYPTETVWGLGCDPHNNQAVEKLLALKRRAWHKGLILIAADYAQLASYIQPVAAARLKHIRARWPGPYTWIFPATRRVPRLVRGQHRTVAVRVTSHPLAAALCREFGGPIVSTSANRSGTAPTRSAWVARRRYTQHVDYFLDGSAGPHTQPSTIRDAATGRIVRR